MKVLILGSLRHDGKYLIELHLGLGDKVIGLAKSICSDSELEPPLLGATYLKLDAQDPVELNKIINRYEPEIIYNLASASSVSESFKFPDISESVNVGIVKNILEILSRRQVEGKDQINLYQASIFELSGGSDRVPLTIKSKFNPQSPDALHKSVGYNLILEYREKFALLLSMGIMFNH
jgi:GDPmannose 4,6-dehydratase